MKGQRVISAFFAKKPAEGTSNADSHQKPKPVPAVEVADLEHAEPPPEPPRKRQRINASNKTALSATSSRAAAAALPDSKPIAANAATSANQAVPASAVDHNVPDPSERGHNAVPLRTAARQHLAKRKLVESAVQEATRRALTTNGGAAPKYTPLEQQIVQLKKQYPGTVLIVEVGYKMRFFGEDAEVASKVCNIFCYPDHNFMTASIPVLRLPIHVRRLVQAGYKVGVVRQVETAAIKATGSNKYTPFERKLTALYTSSTLEAGEKSDKVGEEDAMEASQEMEAALGSRSLCRHLVCLAEETDEEAAVSADSRVAMVAVETSTGQVFHGICRSGHVASELESELLKLEPSELVVMEPLTPHTEKLLKSYVAATPGCRIERKPGVAFLDDAVVEKVTAFYGADANQKEAVEESSGAPNSLSAVMDLEGLMLRALSVAVDYLTPFGLQEVLKDVSTFRPLTSRRELSLSSNAFCQLEILQAGQDAKAKGSVVHLMDQTSTAMGARLLRSWLARPLVDRTAILHRQEAVQELMEALQSGEGPLCSIEPLLRRLPDLEKGVTRIFHRTAAPSEFVQILQALSKVAGKLGLPLVLEDKEVAVPGVRSSLLCSLLKAAASPKVHCLCTELLGAISVKAAQQNSMLDIFASKSRFADVHRCKADVVAAEEHLQTLLPVMAREAGVARLEYVSIQNQGDYLLELPAARQNAPTGWEKVCSTKKVNRWHPPEVKQGMQRLEVAKEHLQAACATAWNQFLGDFTEHYSVCRAAIQALAHLDVLKSFSKLAQSPGYCRPEFVEDDDTPVIDIVGGRHPVLDQASQGGAVPNDVHLSWSGCRSCIVTGPNMGGKSMFIRQVAVIVVMAQVGSFVPAESARLHVVDGIYTRMGASDNLMLGRSTFQEELGDAADTLAKATSRSLVIMDELGRGTATHDGVAIAVACLEHLVTKIGCLSLFVTHYPEVGCVEEKYPGRVAAFHMAYAQEGNPQQLASTSGAPSKASAAADKAASVAPKIVFLYKLVPGIADQSFGMNVALMAGLPPALVQRASLKAAEFHEQMKATETQHQIGRQFVNLVESSLGWLQRVKQTDDSQNGNPASDQEANLVSQLQQMQDQLDL